MPANAALPPTGSPDEDELNSFSGLKTCYGYLCLAMMLLGALACAQGDISITAAPIATSQVAPSGSPTADPQITPTPTAEPTNSNPTATLEVTSEITPSRPEPLVTPTYPATATMALTQEIRTILYEALPGDTLRSVAMRFGVLPEDISVHEGSIPPVESLINPGTYLLIPRRLGEIGPSERLIPDSEFVYSPHAVDFDVESFVADRGGYLTRYRELMASGWMNGAQVLQVAARDNSVNPRILLAMLEYLTSWVTDPATPTGDALVYPLGYQDVRSSGLYHQLTALANEMGVGYYGWRSGAVTEVTLADGEVVRLAPDLNAGTVALQYAFAQRFTSSAWEDALGPDGYLSVYNDLFGDPWLYTHPLYEPGLTQPPMALPFLPGRIWSFTGGPHGAWEREAAWAALDFAPTGVVSGCDVSIDWAAAVAPGLVVRSGNGVVVLDLDGDGSEQTGWVVTYLHVAANGRISEGVHVEEGDLLGHPSCEGGLATGSHIHITRKYNGEWILADGPLPFTLSGWEAHAGAVAYQGALTKDDQTVLACPCASEETLISR
jgi:LasA protease